MWNHKYLARIDFYYIIIVVMLMVISLFVISSMTMDLNSTSDVFFTPLVKSQVQWFIIGWVVFFFFAGFDYRKFSQWSWVLYTIMLVLLLGLFLVSPIQNVHRWYRLPFLGINIQPSEYAKLIVVISLGGLLNKKKYEITNAIVAWQILLIVGLPFLLILKQPDLGTALVLFPIALTMCYFGGVNQKIMKVMTVCGCIAFIFISLVFTDVLSHEKMRPFFTSFLKEYQYERLNPNTYHQKAAQTSIALGGFGGSGWRQSDFASKKWLPAAHTDSVFAAYGEEVGFFGVFLLLLLFYLLIHRSFIIVNSAKEDFGKLLASGIAVYLGMHIIVNIAMMCGFLPISGVPLLLITYGGSSILTTMAAMGILQSIYTRRFMF
jgi:rod shape determining protein RodA